jgi:hypothetical protein
MNSLFGFTSAPSATLSRQLHRNHEFEDLEVPSNPGSRFGAFLLFAFPSWVGFPKTETLANAEPAMNTSALDAL